MTEEKATVVAVWGTELPHWIFPTRMISKKRINRIKATWMIIQFTPYTNHHPIKMVVLPKTFVQIILAAKWLVRHSSTFPKQQRRPLPSLLSLSFFYAQQYTVYKLATCLQDDRQPPAGRHWARSTSCTAC